MISRRQALGLLAAMPLAAACTSTGSGRANLKLATDSDHAPYREIGGALSDVWRTRLSYKVELLGGEGSLQNKAAVAAGVADLALCAADVAAGFQGGPSPSAPTTQALMRLHDDAFHLVVPDLSPIQLVEDLRGKRVSVGAHMSGVRVLAPRVMAAAGLDPTRDVVTFELGLSDAIEALRSGAIDAFFWSGGVPTSQISRLAEAWPVRLIDMSNVVVQLCREYPVYGTSVIPADAYPNQRGPVTVGAIRNLLICGSGIVDDVAYRLTTSVLSNVDELVRRSALFRTVAPITAIDTTPVPLHPGARRAFRDKRSY